MQRPARPPSKILSAASAFCAAAFVVVLALPCLAQGQPERARRSKPPQTNAPAVAPAHPVKRKSNDARQPQAAESTVVDRCLSVSDIHDGDGDFARNQNTLSRPELCIMRETFKEGPFTWKLQIIRNKNSPGSYFWFAPHDNENVAFDTAVYGVANFGGTAVAIETGGSRFNGRQDPNRNFDAATGRKCPQQVAASPLYTANVLKWRSGGNTPVIALHSNERGYNGDGHGGSGGISILKPLPGNSPFPAAKPISTRSPSDSMVFVASTAGRIPSAFIASMNRAGINVMLESVSARSNDCSFSNYAVLTGIGPYVNLEVVHGDGAGQRKMLGIVLPLLPQAGESVSSPAAGRVVKRSSIKKPAVKKKPRQ